MYAAHRQSAVWLVEDSPLEARAISHALADAFACELFEAGSSVLERLATDERPSVLVLDWELPDMSGVDVCRFVRTSCDELSLPILLVTGRQDSADLVDALAAGANDFLTKPYHPAVLLARVKSLARTRDLYREKQRADAERAALVATTAAAQAEAEAERQKLHTVFTQAPVAIAMVEGSEHVFTFANPTYCAVFGGRSLLGRAMTDAFPDAGDQRFNALLDDVLVTGQAFVGQELRIRGSHLADREQRYVTLSYHPKRNAAGVVDGVLISAVDVTEQVLARHRVETASLELQQTEERLRRVVEASGAGLWALDAATGEMAADRRMVALMGLPEGSAFNLAEGLASLPAEDQDRVAASIAAAFAGVDGGRYLTEFRTGGNGDVPLRWVESRAATVFAADGTAVRLQGAMIDITARKLAELERETRAEFERQLIGIVSHDLRSPLSTILLGAQILMAGDGVDEKALRALARIQAAAERGARLVSDLLDFTQARVGGGIPVSASPGNLHVVVRQVVEEISTTSPEREIVVTTSGDGSGTWDLDRMSQVIANLVSNALKYSPAASIVRVVSETDVDGITVMVHNEGAPIANEALARIFQPMQRATSQHENKARSVGLGLFIVKHLVEAHRGRISVTSTADAGTTFAFWVPRHASVTRETAAVAPRY
jgi:PAS domain S-box-containing protein